MMQLYQISVKRLYKFSIQSILSGMDQSCFGEIFILSEQIILSLFHINFIYKLRVCVCVTFEEQLALVIRCSVLIFITNIETSMRAWLYILTSIWVLRTSNAGQNILFLCFCVFSQFFFTKIKKNDAKLHFIFSYPPASEASRDLANLTPVYGVKEFVCQSVCDSCFAKSIGLCLYILID